MKLTGIESLEVPELEPYRTMRRPAEHRASEIFVAEGEKVVRRLVQSDLKIVSLLITKEWLEAYSRLLAEREIEEGVFVAEKSLLEEIVGYRLHQGIMAIGRVPAPVDVFKMQRKAGEKFLLVAADGIANSENMGVIVRNCAAFGVHTLVVGETSCDPYLRRSVRNSMGTIFQMQISNVESLADALRRLREESSFEIVAAHPRSDSVKLSDVDLTNDVCIVFGSEGEGISAGVLNECTIRTRIPIRDEVDSMNVASSVGVILYEAARQRSDLSRRSSM